MPSVIVRPTAAVAAPLARVHQALAFIHALDRMITATKSVAGRPWKRTRGFEQMITGS
jgi:hypothetical protein